MTKINVKHLIYLPIIFFFLPAFAFYFPLTKGVYLFFYISIYINLFVIILIKRNNFIKMVSSIFRKTPLKIFILCVLCMILDSIYLSFIGYTTIPKILVAICLKFVLCIFPILIFFTLLLTRMISYKKFLNIFVLLYWWIVLVFGYITYFADFFDINCINTFIDFFANARILEHQFLTRTYLQDGHYFANGIPRLDGLFTEPAFYARFVFLFLPVAYIYGTKKLKITKNKILNKIIQKTIIPFSLISIILTQSPIYFILTLILISIIYFKKIIYIIKKHYLLVFILLGCFSFLLYINVSNLSNTYFSRIINVLNNIHNFEDFILVEPSLGSRIVCFYNAFLLFIKHPFTGVGMGNINVHMLNQMTNSPIILTYEIQENIKYAISSKNKFGYNRALIYHLLSSYGIIITAIFAYFHLKIYKILNKISSYTNLGYTNYNICLILKNSWIALTILFFYHINSDCYELWFIYALFVGYIINIKKGRLNEKNNIHR